LLAWHKALLSLGAAHGWINQAQGDYKLLGRFDGNLNIAPTAYKTSLHELVE